MSRTFLVVLFVGITISSLCGEDVSNNVKDQAVALYGDQAKRLFDSKVTQIKPRSVSKRLHEFCKPYQFFMVGIPVPEGRRTSMTPDVVFYKMASGVDGVPVGNAKDIAAFLTTLKKPISNEEDVLERINLFAELLDATVATHLPKRKSIIKSYMDQNPENWTLVISGTESGWKVLVTLMTDPAIEYCVRYELELSTEGKLSVLKDQDVYSYTLYE
jgi:hypothetical protein